MKVILLEDVRKLGKKDDVVEVADGYGRNFLIKKGMAVAFNKENEKALAARQAEDAASLARQKEEAEQTAKKLEDMTLEFTLNTGKQGNTFGQISSKQIAAALEKKGIHVEKRKIMMDVPVDSLGTTKVKVDLFKNEVIGTINVHVSAKGA